jgi:signal transduction histidine kinase
MDQKASPPNLKDKIGADTAGSGATEQLREIAHELRNPLNALLAVSEVFRDERFGKLSNDRYRRYAELSHEATVRMLSLCEQLLNGHPEADKESGIESAVRVQRPLKDTIRDVVELFGPMAEERDVLLNMQFSDEMLAKVQVNAELVTSTLNNLIANAIKFTPRGGRVSVIAKSDGSSDVIVLVVSDTGVGIDPEQIAQIMGVDTFKPRKTTGLHGDHGSGLGLFMVRRSLEMAGGSLELRSKPGLGTCAIVRLCTIKNPHKA